MKPDFCYIFGAQWNPHRKHFDPGMRVKIGCTSNPKQRLSNLRTLQPCGVFLHVWYQQELGMEIERSLHSYYASARIAGEYFELPEWEINWLMGLPSEFFMGSHEVNWHDLLITDWREKWIVSGYNHSEPHVVFMDWLDQCEIAPNACDYIRMSTLVAQKAFAELKNNSHSLLCIR